MKTILKTSKNLFLITKFSIIDQVKQKSFIFILIMGIILILLLKGCSSSNININGNTISPDAVAIQISKISFYIASAFTYLIAVLLSMSIFNRDLKDGTVTMFLIRPVRRSFYILGKLLSVIILSSIFLFIMTTTIIIFNQFSSGKVEFKYFSSAGISVFNICFATTLTFLLTMFVKNFLAGFITLMVTLISSISDIAIIAVNSNLFKSFSQQDLSQTTVPLWRILFPKIYYLQTYAASRLDNAPFTYHGVIHPLLNITFYIIIFLLLALFKFRKMDLQS